MCCPKFLQGVDDINGHSAIIYEPDRTATGPRAFMQVYLTETFHSPPRRRVDPAIKVRNIFGPVLENFVGLLEYGYTVRQVAGIVSCRASRSLKVTTAISTAPLSSSLATSWMGAKLLKSYIYSFTGVWMRGRVIPVFGRA